MKEEENQEMTDKELELENRFNRIENTVNALGFFSLAQFIFVVVFMIRFIG